MWFIDLIKQCLHGLLPVLPAHIFRRDQHNRRTRKPFPALERLRPHYCALLITTCRLLFGVRHSPTSAPLTPSDNPRVTTPRDERLLRPITSRIAHRAYPPNIDDAFVRWNKVGAAQAGTPRRRRMRQDIVVECFYKRILPYSVKIMSTVCMPSSRFSRPHQLTDVTDIYIDNTHVELSLWDTAGQEEFDRLRSLSYDDTHAIMLCFSVDSPDSLENVETKWVGEIAENCPNVKLVLVALKCDLRKREDDDVEGAEPEKPCIDYEEGLRVAEKIKALRYLECSAMKNRGVNEAFTEAARVALQVKNSKDKSGGCTIM
ncbi:hypothetical protein OPT61_g2405 [Boeremia exigua]|uniref:Uncharacterized protein n=1 Tax=Boeremia exigua TaxID=749465 RepID=A0ACC2ILU9_9PLEO|nr:hypothetical protein OPT61_g2405 [Boeremia exigua]